MKTAVIIVTSLLAVSSAAADPSTRLRNASANELCWDTARGFAREKYPSVNLDDPQATLVNVSQPVERPAIKESRKSFPGIRNC